MKNLKKLFAVVIAVAMLVTVMAPAFAAGGAFSYEAEAQVLNDLGLYKGISTTEFVPDLGTALNRETGVVMLLRIFGLEADAEAVTDADATLAKFSDAASISAWAKNAVAYAVENGLVKGYPDGTFGPKLALNGKAYCTLILAQLGYTPDYSNAPAELADKGGLTVLQAVKFTEKDLIKDDLVGISYGTLKAKYSDGATVIEKLIEANPDLEEVAITAGLVEELTITSLASVPAVKVKVGETATLPATVTATYSDKTTADVAVTWGAVDTSKAGTVTVAGTVEGTDLKASVTVTVEAVPFAVDSVTALNCKQIQIVFNKALDSDSAKTVGNYEVADLGTAAIAATPVLQDDSKTVILTLNPATNAALTNSTNAKVTVKKDIKTADGTTLGTDYVNSAVKVSDGMIPEAKKAEAIGSKTIKLTFNAPVYDGGATTTLTSGEFAVKNGTYTYYVNSAKADFANNTVTITLGTNLVAGNVTVTINPNGADANAIRSFAGIKAFNSQVSFTYALDTTPATVTIKEATQEHVTLKFSKPVNATNVTLFHSVKGVSDYSKTLNINAADEVEFDFGNKLPTGNVTLYLVNSTTSGNEITDLFGVKVPDTTLTATIVADTTPPSVSSTTVNGSSNYQITFSEKIDTAEAKAENFSLKTVSDGKAVDFTVSDDGDKVVTISPSGGFTDNTAYELVIKNMKDKAGNALAAAITLDFTVGDNTNPSVSDIYAVNADGKIFITYSEPMNETQMIDKSNYLVDVDPAAVGHKYAALGENDTVTKISDKAVVIDMNSAVNKPNVMFATITDKAGKKLGDDTTIGYTKLGILTEALSMDKAELIAKNKVKITFSKELGGFNANELLLVQTGTATPFTTPIKIASIESITTNSDGKGEVVVVLDQDVNTDATAKEAGVATAIDVIANGVPKDTKTVNGATLGGAAVATVSDVVAPELETIKIAGTDYKDVTIGSFSTAPSAGGRVNNAVTAKITLNFTENMNAATLSKLSFTVAGYTVTAIALNGADHSKVELSVKANADNTTSKPVVTQIYNISDANDNTFVSGTSWTAQIP